MFSRYEFSLSEIERRLRNMLLVGVVEEVREGEAKVNLGEKGFTTDWIPILATASDFLLPLKKGDQVAMLNTGNIHSSVVLGVIRKEKDLFGKEDEILLRRKAKMGIEAKKMSFDVEKFEVKRGNDELVSTIIEALKSIAPTTLGLLGTAQVTIPENIALSLIIKKLEMFVGD